MFVKSTNSTNTLLKELLTKDEWPEGERFLRAGFQTAGRGQAGNGWESEEGKNLLCSILISRQPSAVSHQPFYLNVAVSVAVHRMVSHQLSAVSHQLTIKWPNDIYWGDKKISGILIENAMIGNKLTYSIAGIGLNVNQTEWKSDAPNPVSMKQVVESCQPSAVSHQIADFNIDELMERLMEEIDRAQEEDVWDYYKAHLYRREGYWPFMEREVSVAPTMNATTAVSSQPSAVSFMACIKDVLPTGEIVLEDQQGKERKYHFKQIRYVI